MKSVTAGGSVTVQDSAGVERTVQLATASGVTVTTGIPDPTGGSAGDLYLQLNASDQVIAFWENEAGTWAEYGIMGGSGVALSDDDPRSVSTGDNSEGTAIDASRQRPPSPSSWR